MDMGGDLSTAAAFDGTNGAQVTCLIAASDGNFYGTTANGGMGYNGNPNSGYGTVFRLAPDGALSTIVTFAGTNGSYPSFLSGASLIQAPDGNLYGATTDAGAFTNATNPLECGTIFKVTPTGTLSTLVNFDGTNGSAPGGLIRAADGNLYGTTALGGAYNAGTIFRLSIPMAPLITSVAKMSDNIFLTWSSIAGQKYQLQYLTNPSLANWSNLGPPSTATNGTMTS